ncbi:hypothetical protein ES705_21536 [subsurface metagenome]|jgi:tRNA threonylcarbamoyladenosine modification (KEOPS) complex  Pcc1 subunit
MVSNFISDIELVMKIKLENRLVSKLLFDALNIETTYNPNDRASVRLSTEDEQLILIIIAQDSVSARAAMNSYMRWINLSLQILSNIGKK